MSKEYEIPVIANDFGYAFEILEQSACCVKSLKAANEELFWENDTPPDQPGGDNSHRAA